MKLVTVKIANYKSIIGSEVKLGQSDNIISLIGQNESGKSSILEALRDYYQGKFDDNSFPYESKGNSEIKQSVSCTFEFEDEDKKEDVLTKIVDFAGKKIYGKSIKISQTILNKTSNFSITFDGQYYEFDINFINLFRNSLKWDITEAADGVEENKDNIEPQTTETEEVEVKEQEEPPEWNLLHHDLSDFFVKSILPEIIFFEGGECDILPDFISIEDLENKKSDGWVAVDRLQKCVQELNNDPSFSFKKLSNTTSITRRDLVNQSVSNVTADFKTDFSQKIHGIDEDNLNIVFNLDKRKEGEDAIDQDYLDFAVETKAGNPLPVRMRSKGMIWFLSFWLALKSLKERKSIILIDEPDKNLHINAQKDLLSIFEKISKKFNHQIIYATHAPSLVPLDLIYRIYLVFNDKNKGTFCENILKTQIGNSKNKQEAISLVNYAIGCEVPHQNMVFKSKNVILEGPSDFMYFQAMVKLFEKNIDYAFIPGVGTKGNKLNPLVSICIGYNLNWCVVLDGDKSGKDKFDELKNSIFAGDEKEAMVKIKRIKHDNIEDIFSIKDIELIASGERSFILGTKPQTKNNIAYIGDKRKNTFATLFLRKAENGIIKKEQLSHTTIKDFEEIFEFIEKAPK